MEAFNRIAVVEIGMQFVTRIIDGRL